MFPNFEERASDSPLVERIWRSHSERADSFTSISTVCWSMVVSSRGSNPDAEAIRASTIKLLDLVERSISG